MVQVKVTLHGSLTELFKNEPVAVRHAATAAVRTASFGVRKDIAQSLRRVVKRNPRTIDKAIRVKVYPEQGEALNPKATTYSKAIYSRKSGLIDLLALHDARYTIDPFERKWLALPTKDAPLKAGRGRKRFATPRESKLQFEFVLIKGRGGKQQAMLVDKASGKVMYILVRVVNRVKKIDIMSIHNRRAAKMEDNFIRFLNEQGTTYRR
jgi:hypothetical protein